jgi:phosphopantetheine--protein transferase-like protein
VSGAVADYDVAFLIALPWGQCAGVALPPVRGKIVAVAPVSEAALARLAVAERAHAETLPPGRAVTWVGGRLALRAALHALGADAAARTAPDTDVAPILSDDRGAPVLPAGVVGSISHKDGLAVALASVEDGWRVGVDVELLRPSRHDIAPRVLDADERAALVGLDEAARRAEVLVRFALKEAVYKALDPSLRRYIGFHEVQTRRDHQGALHASFLPRHGEPHFTVEVLPLAAPLPEQILLAARAKRRSVAVTPTLSL